MKPIFTLFLLCLALAATAQTKDGIFQLDRDYSMKPQGTIKMSTSDATVTITGTTRANAHVKIYRQVTTKGIVFGQEEFSVDITEDNGDLTIRERSNSTVVGMVGYHYEKYTVAIEAPEGANLQIRGDDGNYRIKNVNGSISLDLDDADVNLAGCSGDNFRFQLDDGDVVMDEGRGVLDVDADDADVRIEHANFSSISADMDDGDLIIETSLANAGNYYINSQDGLVALTITQGGGKFDIRHGDSRIVTEGDFQQVERSENRTSLVLASGNAQVDIHSDDARVKLIKR
jgi:hypothetical protein